MAGKLAVFVHVDGVAYGPDDDVPAEVAARIVNPDAWEGGQAPTSAASSGGEKPAGNASRDEWAAYAAGEGAPEDETADGGLTRDDLRAKYGA